LSGGRARQGRRAGRSARQEGRPAPFILAGARLVVDLGQLEAVAIEVAAGARLGTFAPDSFEAKAKRDGLSKDSIHV